MFISECIRIGNTFFAAAHKEAEPADPAKKAEEEKFEGKRIVFADFMQGREGEARPYYEVEDLNKLIEKIVEYLE